MEWEEINRKYEQEKASSVYNYAFKQPKEIIESGEKVEGSGIHKANELRKSAVQGYGYLKSFYIQLRQFKFRTLKPNFNTIMKNLDEAIFETGEHYTSKIENELNTIYKYLNPQPLLKKIIEIELSIIHILITLHKTNPQCTWFMLIERGVQRIEILTKL